MLKFTHAALRMSQQTLGRLPALLGIVYQRTARVTARNPCARACPGTRRAAAWRASGATSWNAGHCLPTHRACHGNKEPLCQGVFWDAEGGCLAGERRDVMVCRALSTNAPRMSRQQGTPAPGRVLGRGGRLPVGRAAQRHGMLGIVK